MCLSAKRSYPGDVSAPRAARHFGHSIVVAALVPAGWALADDVSVVISELATTAVNDGATMIELQVTVHYDRLVIDLIHDAPALVGARAQPNDARQARQALLRALTTRLDTGSSPAGRVCTEAEMRCNPRHTGKVTCRHRPKIAPA